MYKLLVESIDMDTVMSQPYFEHFKKLRVYHSTPNKFTEVTKVDFRFRTKPTDTIREFHDMVNNISTEKFGLPIRNLLFTYPHISNSYGYPYLIVPIGENFKLYHHPGIDDMTEDLSDENMDIIVELDFQRLNDKFRIKDTRYDEIHAIFFEKLSENYDDYRIINDHMIPEILTDMADDEYFDEEIMSSYKNYMEGKKDEIVKFTNQLISEGFFEIAKDYVNGVELIDDDSDVGGDEIMVYAPDGFYVVPIE